MDIISILVISFALAMDAFAVSITNGLIMCPPRVRTAFLIAFFFGSFQALMPFLGWLVGVQCRYFVQTVDHWIAFGLLSFIGGKMVYEALVIEHERQKSLTLATLFLLAIATSIDAFAAGITFAFLNVNIMSPFVIIGAVTFCMSLIGVWIGCRFGKNLGGIAEALGGIVLIILGIKILFQHLWK